MSDAPNSEPPKTTAPARSTRTPLSSLRFDPAILPLIIGGLVLVGVLIWLFATPRLQPEPEAERLTVLERRLAALEGRPAPPPPPDLAPLEQRLAQAERAQQGVPALEQRLATLEARPEAPVAEAVQSRFEALDARASAVEARAAEVIQRAAALEAQLQQLANRPVIDPATVAQRQAVEQLAARLDRLAERQEALAARLQAADAEAARRDEALARTITERLTALERGVTERFGVAERAIEQRLSELRQATEAADAELRSALEQRLATLEQAQQRLAAVEERARRLAALDALRARLDVGAALGPALQTLQNPPPALARFAAAPPPTEAGLRLSFEEAARAARAASDPGRQGQGVLDSAVSRLSGLVTVRRGEEVVWGDAAAAEIEGARRALEAGDLEGALERLRRLPPQAQEALRPWIEQAESLIAARAALRQMGAG